MSDAPRRRITADQADRIERKLDEVLALLRGSQGRSGGAEGVRTLASGDVFAPGTGTLSTEPRDPSDYPPIDLENADA